MGSNWMRAKVAKLKPQMAEAAADATARDVYAAIHDPRPMTRAELEALVAGYDGEITVCKPANLIHHRDIGREGKRRRSFNQGGIGGNGRRIVGTAGTRKEEYNDWIAKYRADWELYTEA